MGWMGRGDKKGVLKREMKNLARRDTKSGWVDRGKRAVFFHDV